MVADRNERQCRCTFRGRDKRVCRVLVVDAVLVSFASDSVQPEKLLQGVLCFRTDLAVSKVCIVSVCKMSA